MNDDANIRNLFQPFREAKAPRGFEARVMAQVRAERAPIRSWANRLGLDHAFGRWVWAGGFALAASIAVMIPRDQGPRPFTKTDLSIYLADSTHLEEEADLGTGIESYYL